MFALMFTLCFRAEPCVQLQVPSLGKRRLILDRKVSMAETADCCIQTLSRVRRNDLQRNTVY